MPATQTPVSPLIEIADLIVARPSLERIAAFHFSPQAQELASELLEKKRDDRLTREERDLLEQFVHAETIVRLAKARAHARLKANGKA
jgi:hypothetical protein